MESRRQRGAMNVGTASLMVILIGLSFAVLAALALSSAHHDYALSQELGEHTKAFYAADAKAQEKLLDIETLFADRDEKGVTAYAVDIDDSQQLQVEVTFEGSAADYKITKWQVVNTKTWEVDETMPGLLVGEDE